MTNLMSFEECLVSEMCIERGVINHVCVSTQLQKLCTSFGFSVKCPIYELRASIRLKHEFLFDDSRTLIMAMRAIDLYVAGRTCICCSKSPNPSVNNEAVAVAISQLLQSPFNPQCFCLSKRSNH